MTSGMLPRLQELHDEQRCLIFLATNFPETIDPAVRRSGRFDFRQNIGHPSVARVIAYLKYVNSDEPSKFKKDLEKEFTAGVRKQAIDVVTKELEAAKDTFKTDLPFKKAEDLTRAAAQIVKAGRWQRDFVDPFDDRSDVVPVLISHPCPACVPFQVGVRDHGPFSGVRPQGLRPCGKRGHHGCDALIVEVAGDETAGCIERAGLDFEQVGSALLAEHTIDASIRVLPEWEKIDRGRD